MDIRYQYIRATYDDEPQESTTLELGQILADNHAVLIGCDESDGEIVWNFEIDPGMGYDDDSITGIDVFFPIEA